MKRIMTASAVFLWVIGITLVISGCGVQINQNGDMVFTSEERILLSEGDAEPDTEPESEAASVLPGNKYIGEPSEGEYVRKITLLNLTGQNITAVSVVNPDEDTQQVSENSENKSEENKSSADNSEKSEIQSSSEVISGEENLKENMLPKGEVFEADEVRDLYFDFASAMEKEQDLSRLHFNVSFTLEDGTTSVLHDFPFFDLEQGRICLQDEVLFLEYVSVWSKEEVVTRKAETEIKAAEIKAMEEAEAEKKAAEEAEKKAAEEAARKAEEEAAAALAAQQWQEQQLAAQQAQQWAAQQEAAQWQPDYSGQQGSGAGCIDDSSLMY